MNSMYIVNRKIGDVKNDPDNDKMNETLSDEAWRKSWLIKILFA